MSAKTVIAALVFVCSLDGAAAFNALGAAAGTAPHMATGHVGGAGMPAVTETANQISAGRAIGARVYQKNGKEVATIADLIVDRRQGAVALAVLKPAGSAVFKGGPTAVAWSSLHFRPTPTPRFVTALGRKAFAAGVSLERQARDNPAYYDVKADLLGKQAVGPHGAALGQIGDLVVEFGSGRLVALVIDTGGPFAVGVKTHAVAWSKAQPHGKDPVHLALSKKAVDSTPVTATMTPLPAPTHRRGAAPAVIRRDQTGNLSGTAIPGPATRR
jgi:sporulation protein YlmC with PRC-barrel domain